MSILIIQLPPRDRLGDDGAPSTVPPAGGDATAAALRRRVGEDLAYTLSADGLTVSRHAVVAPMLLPRAETVVAVVPCAEVSWHRITVPKAPASRLQAALSGLLEEALLEDPADVHLALAPGARAGESAWVAACSKSWLSQRLEQLDKARIRVDRVVPAVWPDEPPSGYFSEADDGDEGDINRAVRLTWSNREGVATWPLRGGYSRALLPDPLPPTVRFFATPGVAAPAERWLGAAVSVQSEPERMVQASRSLWNLLQFDLAPRHRGLGIVQERWRRFMGPAWRPARIGLIALVATQVIGLNLWAWHQRAGIKAKQDEMVKLLREAHPGVTAVLDAPVQMRRETDALRASAGQAGEDDLETLLQVAASAWPQGQALAGLQYDSGTLTLSVAGWPPFQVDQFRSTIEAAGFRVDSMDDRVALSRVRRS